MGLSLSAGTSAAPRKETVAPASVNFSPWSCFWNSAREIWTPLTTIVAEFVEGADEILIDGFDDRDGVFLGPLNEIRKNRKDVCSGHSY